MNSRIKYMDYTAHAEAFKLPSLIEHNHYFIELMQEDTSNVNDLIVATNMTWDKYMGVVCSNRDIHNISLDVEEIPTLSFYKTDIELVEKYLKLEKS